MEIFVKPITPAESGDINTCEWVLYKSGNYKYPLAILSHGEAEYFVKEFLKIHKEKIVDKMCGN